MPRNLEENPPPAFFVCTNDYGVEGVACNDANELRTQLEEWMLEDDSLTEDKVFVFRTSDRIPFTVRRFEVEISL